MIKHFVIKHFSAAAAARWKKYARECLKMN